ncbi:uncharacterized protein LOC122065097 [Macadamia integrifolia]|uniref:uncharacterized protein LOC122065097 n=1 Tax=Macadamia integrifolia TaxID=60698 RepID=UPI001C4F67AC|nr:uncharacterized protein LOC122065097 [Macadamia integrifolia]
MEVVVVGGNGLRGNAYLRKNSDDEYDEYYQRREKVIIFTATAVVIAVEQYKKVFLCKQLYRNETRRGSVETQRIIGHTDKTCRNMIRMSRKAFFNLCQVMRDKGLLYDTNNVQVEEQVVIVLYAIGHNVKNRVLLHLFGHSAYNSRILDDAIHREGEAKLPVPRGKFYLVDAGFANQKGFLRPYHNVRYHLKEWRNSNVSPADKKELFNLRHSRLRNIIERAFGLLKSRFKILKSQPEYSFKTQARIVQACVMIQNHILTQNSVQEEEEWLEQENAVTSENTNEEVEDNDENSDKDSDVDDEDDNFDQDQFREEMADYMWNDWMARDDSNEEMHVSSYESQ